MAESKVYTSDKWNVDKERLRAAGVHVSTSNEYPDAMVGVPEPGYGETILGELNDEEKAIFVEMKKSSEELERLGREYLGRSLERFGHGIRQSDVTKPLHEAMQDQSMTFESEEEKMDFARLERKANMLRHTFYWLVGERFKCHEYTIGVRSRFRAVKSKERY